MKILIDNGHGFNTAGKCSPDGSLREYAYTREIAIRVVNELTSRGYDADRIVKEVKDISLTERCKRVNAFCKSLGLKNVILVSIHVNAAGADGKWHDANGFSVHVNKTSSSDSKKLASSLIESAESVGLKVRKYSQLSPYWPQNLAICRDTLCPAVLTENLFQDNKSDVAFLLSEEGKEAVTQLHVNGIINYIEIHK